MIQTISFNATQSGPHILFLGAIHGKEKAGTYAIQKFITQLQNKEIELQKGSITCIPICNPVAFENDTRQVEQNLNRVMKYRAQPQSYEQKLANLIIPYIDECDWVIDLHSTYAPSPAFVCDDYPSQETEKISKKLPFGYIVKDRQSLSHAQDTRDSMRYAHAKNKYGLLIECGQHVDNQAEQHAYESIMTTCICLGIITGTRQDTQKQIPISAHKTYIKESAGHFSKERKDFDSVQKNEVLAVYDNGTQILAPESGYLLLPNNECFIGEEWFYFGI